MSDTPKPEPLSAAEVVKVDEWLARFPRHQFSADVTVETLKRFRATISAREQRIEELERRHGLLREAVNSFTPDCEPSCDSLAHAETCKKCDAAATLVNQQAEVRRKDEALRRIELVARPFDDTDGPTMASQLERIHVLADAALAPSEPEPGKAEPGMCDYQMPMTLCHCCSTPVHLCGAPVTSGTRCAAHQEPRG